MDVQKESMVNTGHINTDPGCSMTLDLDMVLSRSTGHTSTWLHRLHFGMILGGNTGYREATDINP